jgi:hypothetical protein
MALLAGIVRAIIAQEAYPTRFEKFAVDIVSRIEGDAALVTTSSNYDQGRDGVSVGGAPKIVVCCSLTDQVEEKALTDAKKLARTSNNLERVYFCSSKQFTGRVGDELAAKFGTAAKCPGRVQTLSQDKLVQFGSVYDDIVRKHYPAEVHQALAALAEGAGAAEQEQSLRLALTVAGTDDAAAIREGVWAAALRHALSDGAQRTAADIAAILSNSLRLGAALRAEVVRTHLASQVEAGLVERFGDQFGLTDTGKAALAADSEHSARAIFEGRDAFKEAVEAALRQRVTQDQAAAMWSAMQDQLATLLYARGREVLTLLAPLLTATKDTPAEAAPPSPNDAAPSRAADPNAAGPDPATPADTPSSAATDAPPPSVPTTNRAPVPQPPHKDIVEPLATAAASAFQLPAQAEEVRAAVRDLLHAGAGPAVDWLTRACFGFVCACSLGLEVRTQVALAEVIARTTLERIS